MFSFQTFCSIGRALLTKRSPYYIQFYINGRCNLMCRQCNIVETNSRIAEMNVDQIKAVAKNLRRIGAGIVLLTGGEPFLRRDLPEIVEAFCSNGLNVRLQTAGTKVATESMLRNCYEAGARDINVSVDSLDFNSFDYINGVPNSSANAFSTIELISSIFRDKSAILSFGTVLSRFNYREIPAIVEFAHRIGWYVSLVPVHIASRGNPKGFRSFESNFSFPDSMHKELDTLAATLGSLKRSYPNFFDSRKFLISAIDFLKGKPPTWRVNDICDSPNLYFAIRPNGDFTTCCDYTLQNAPKVYDDAFVESYRSGRLQRREDVLSIVRNCSGCHYGSYPEVTLSVRNFDAFLDRAWLVVRSRGGRLKGAPVQGNFFAELDRIRSTFPQVYPVSQWIGADLMEVLDKWRDADLRKEILAEDIQRRAFEGRVRGQGEDALIGAEPQKS